MKDALHHLKHEKFNLTYSEWQKVKITGSTSIISKKIPLIVSTEDFIEQHLEPAHQQFKAAKNAKADARASNDTATLQIDWAENYNIRKAQEEKGNSE